MRYSGTGKKERSPKLRVGRSSGPSIWRACSATPIKVWVTPSWEEFHGIADAHGVRLDLRANGFVFTHRRSLVRVKASSISRHLGKPALEALLGTFIPAEYQQGREEQRYEKKPRFARVDTSRLWEEY
jgi:hypothetical protein